MVDSQKLNELLKSEAFVGKDTRDPLHEAFVVETVAGHPGGMPRKPAEPKDFQMMWNNAVSQPGKDPDRSIYIHTPFCRLRCLYCGFFKNFKDIERQDQYVMHLLKEINTAGKQPYVQGEPIKSIYFGGGTPGVLRPEQIRELLQALKDNAPIAPDCEITFETSICDLDDDQITACLDGGVNRFSFGVQTFDTKIRRSMGRPDDKDTLRNRLNEISTMQDQATVVIDLIYGFPGQTAAHWQEDLEIAIASSIHGLDTYSLKVFPGSLLDQVIQKGDLPKEADRATQADMYVQAVQTLEKAGLRKLSVCHWGRFDMKEHSRYNRMSKSGAACIPFGAGGGGNIDGMSVMLQGDVDKYEAMVEEGLKPISFASPVTPFHKLCGRVRGDMDQGFLSLGDLDAEFKLPVSGYLTPLFDVWERRGLVNRAMDRIDLTLAGQVWNVEMTRSVIGFLQMQLNSKTGK